MGGPAPRKEGDPFSIMDLAMRAGPEAGGQGHKSGDFGGAGHAGTENFRDHLNPL